MFVYKLQEGLTIACIHNDMHEDISHKFDEKCECIRQNTTANYT